GSGNTFLFFLLPIEVVRSGLTVESTCPRPAVGVPLHGHLQGACIFCAFLTTFILPFLIKKSRGAGRRSVGHHTAPLLASANGSSLLSHRERGGGLLAWLVCDARNFVGRLRSRVSCGCGAGQPVRSFGRWLENYQTFLAPLVVDTRNFSNAADEINYRFIGGEYLPEALPHTLGQLLDAVLRRP